MEVGVDYVKPLNSDKNLKNRFTVMYSGILGLGYDFNVVLEAAQLLDKNDDIVFILRGTGEVAPKLKKTIRERGLGNVFLDTRFLSKDELASMLESADVFVLPMATMSFVDFGLPTKIFEYQSYGKPIICVSSGESARYIETSKSGLIVKPKDAKGFAEAIITLFEDEEYCNKLGLNGREYVSKHLTSKKVGERMFDLLNSVACCNN